jgi:hypothetical protein
MAIDACEKILKQIQESVAMTFRYIASLSTHHSNIAEHARKNLPPAQQENSALLNLGNKEPRAKINNELAETRGTYCGKCCLPLK